MDLHPVLDQTKLQNLTKISKTKGFYKTKKNHFQNRTPQVLSNKGKKRFKTQTEVPLRNWEADNTGVMIHSNWLRFRQVHLNKNTQNTKIKFPKKLYSDFLFPSCINQCFFLRNFSIFWKINWGNFGFPSVISTNFANFV